MGLHSYSCNIFSNIPLQVLDNKLKLVYVFIFHCFLPSPSVFVGTIKKFIEPRLSENKYNSYSSKYYGEDKINTIPQFYVGINVILDESNKLIFRKLTK